MHDAGNRGGAAPTASHHDDRSLVVRGLRIGNPNATRILHGVVETTFCHLLGAHMGIGTLVGLLQCGNRRRNRVGNERCNDRVGEDVFRERHA